MHTKYTTRWALAFRSPSIEKCLIIELRKQELEAQSQKSIVVRYEGEIVGEFLADIIVEDTIIVELKSVRRIVVAHEIQLVNYLVATGKPVGLLLNFAERKVEVKRKVREFKQEQTGLRLSCLSCYPVKIHDRICET